MADYQGDPEDDIAPFFQSELEMSQLSLELGVNQRLTLCHCQDMAFSSIFSHFSQFLAKMAEFWDDIEALWNQNYNKQ